MIESNSDLDAAVSSVKIELEQEVPLPRFLLVILHLYVLQQLNTSLVPIESQCKIANYYSINVYMMKAPPRGLFEFLSLDQIVSLSMLLGNDRLDLVVRLL